VHGEHAVEACGFPRQGSAVSDPKVDAAGLDEVATTMPGHLLGVSRDVEASERGSGYRARQLGEGAPMAEPDFEDSLAVEDAECREHLAVEGSGLARHDAHEQPAEQAGRSARLPGDEGGPAHQRLSAARTPSR
jgi:hypothetical protein